ncbi:MAG: efflux RND transporter periplasmic adaptor subunit [Verrucomicrobiota bacterium]
MQVPTQTSNPILMVALDIQLQLNAQTRHQAAVMLFCNELAFHFKCVRASLGWMRNEELRMVATSHSNKFEERFEIARDLVSAMLESLDQDAEIVWPEEKESSLIIRYHEVYARKYGSRHLLTIPMRLDGEVQGVLTLERQDRAFSVEELEALRLICDLCARRLGDLEQTGRVWWKPTEVKMRRWLSQFLGPERTLLKFSVIAGTVFAVFFFLIPLPYRVNGDFTLKTRTLQNLPAPFDGYLKNVEVYAGDPVVKGQSLYGLDTEELKLQEAEAMANRLKSDSEAQLAQGESRISDMHAKFAQASQSDAKLSLVRSNLSRAIVRAPFDGVVLEGDLRDKIGAPVKKGDVLMRACRFEDLYIEVEVSERDVQDVRENKEGWIRFAGRPEETYEMTVERIEPAAVAKPKGNIFLVRGRLEDNPAIWFRPGMSGTARMKSDWRSLWFQVGHRLMDFVRLKLWW